jgi:hypothetical protein
MKKRVLNIIVIIFIITFIISPVSAGLITDFNNWLKDFLNINKNSGYTGELGSAGILTDSNSDNIYEIYDCSDLQSIGQTENLGKNYILMNDIDCRGFDPLGSWCSGTDLNHDGKVMDEDAAILAANWGKTNCSIINNWCSRADVNKDRTVDDKDASIIAANRGRTDCFGGFVPIGDGSATSTNPFTGTFDGNGYIISNLFIDQRTNIKVNNAGLFGYNSGIIKNLGLVNMQISGKSFVGALVGYNDHGTIENCYSIGSINGESHTGGLVGMNYYGTISKCYSLAEVLGDGNFIAGLVGRNSFGTIENSYYAGPEVDGNSYVAGLTNFDINSVGTIRNCLSLSKRTTGNSNVGRLISKGVGASVSVIDSYSGGMTCRDSCSDSIYIRNASDLKNSSWTGYSNWDFTNTWIMTTGEFPNLRNFNPNCIPKTCPELGKNCGKWFNGCGQNIDCGYCPAGIGCYNGTCMSCVPKTCRELGKECGSFDNGCGGKVDCGKCNIIENCSSKDDCPNIIGEKYCNGTKSCGSLTQRDCVNNTCITIGGSIGCTDCPNACNNGLCIENNCTPITCNELNKGCGNWPDNCNNTINCGYCYKNEFCNDGTCIECLNDSECNDDELCTDDICTMGKCKHIPKSCDSGFDCYEGNCEKITPVDYIKCNDSDNGKAIYIKGMTQGYNNGFFGLFKQWVTKEDTCKNIKELIEYYCINDSIKSIVYTCMGNCLNGICTDTTIPENIECNYNNRCIPYLKKTSSSCSWDCTSVKNFEDIRWDSIMGSYTNALSCEESIYLSKEYLTWEKTGKYNGIITKTFPDNKKYVNRKCVCNYNKCELVKTATDSDSGINYWLKGTCKDFSGNNGSLKVYTDFCTKTEKNQSAVMEFYPAENDLCEIKIGVCYNNCLDGECIKYEE